MRPIRLWDKTVEKKFFKEYVEKTSPNKCFYISEDKKYLAYWPKGYKGRKTTLQSRNAFIGAYTEKWVSDFFETIAESINAHPVQNVICDEIGLSNQSPADLAICITEDREQKPEDIILIIEVKMSIVWNWEYNTKNKIIKCIGDYTTHQGTPGLLRSDSMLKAIGKSLNIRVSGFNASKIPIIIIGNTPITKSYYSKVDHLKQAGIIQGFYSLNPNPLEKTDNEKNLKNTLKYGFQRINDYEEFKNTIMPLLKEDREFFSGMTNKPELGKLIEIANQESTYELKAEKFLQLLREE